MIELILKLGGLQAILFSIFLFGKSTSNRANFVLALLVLFLGISCIAYSFNNLDFYLRFPHLIRVDWGIPLLFGPLVYLYTAFLLTKTKWSEKLWYHFIPYFINLVILIPFFIKPSEEKIQILDYFTATITSGTDLYYFYGFILQIAISIFNVAYAYDSIKIVVRYRENLLQEYSNLEKLKLEWLRALLYFFMLSSIAFIIVSVVTFQDRYPQFDYHIYYFVFLFIFIYFLSYKALSKPKIVSAEFLSDRAATKESKKPKEPLKQSSSTKLGEKLKVFMQTEKPYLNGELTASQLAEQLNISRHALSQVLNDQLGKNFYDFINEYRVLEFKERISLSENSHLTILGVAFDSGFNSKTTFNTIFKKSTSLTPSQYKNSIK